MHEVPDKAGPGVELLATSTADGAKGKTPGRMQGPMDASTMGTPGSDSGKETTTIIAKVPAAHLGPGRTFRQRQTAKREHAVELTPPLTT